MCILVVDDNADTLDLFSLLLRQLGHTVHGARSGAAALRQMAVLHPDLVFLDLTLPEGDGFEVAKHVRRQPKFSDTKIVAVTGHADSSHRQRAHLAGFDAYLLKPVALADITATIDTVRQTLLSSGHETHPNC